MGVNETQYGDHVTICTDVESCGTPESDIMLYVNYRPIKTILDYVMSPCTQDAGKRRGALNRQMSEYSNREAIKGKRDNTILSSILWP